MEKDSIGLEVLRRNIPYILAISSLAGFSLVDHCSPPQAEESVDTEPASEQILDILDDNDSPE